MLASPLASVPRLIEPISARTQWASLILCSAVMSPIPLSVTAMAATVNGRIMAGENAKPPWAKCGIANRCNSASTPHASFGNTPVTIAAP